MPKQVVFILRDVDHERAGKYVDDKHIGFMASVAFEEWLKRREARTRRQEWERRYSEKD